MKKTILVMIMFLFSAVSLNAATLLADKSYYPVLFNKLRDAQQRIDVVVSELKIDRSDDQDNTLRVLRILQNSAVRGLEVSIACPKGSIPTDIAQKLKDQGVVILPYKKKISQCKIVVDGNTITGSHRWNNPREKHNISFLFDKNETFEELSSKKVAKKIAKKLSKSPKDAFWAVDDIYAFKKRDREKIYNQLEKRAGKKMNTLVLFGQSTIKQYSIARLFNDSEPNIKDAMNLHYRNVPVWIDSDDAQFDFTLFVIGDEVLLGCHDVKNNKPYSYIRLVSDKMSQDIVTYVDSIPKLLIKDIIKYN